jgi:hypothetical protein
MKSVNNGNKSRFRMERLEERIAPCGCYWSDGGSSKSKKSHKSRKSHKSHKSHKSGKC